VKLLGHASIITTEIYTKVAIRKLEERAREHAPTGVMDSGAAVKWGATAAE